MTINITKLIPLFYLMLITLLFSCDSNTGIHNKKYELSIVFDSTNGAIGEVTIQPNNITCTTNCTAEIIDGTFVQLTTRAGDDSSFTGWGGGCLNNSLCQLSMNKNQIVQAKFIKKPLNYELTAKTTIGGSISFDNGLTECFDNCGYNLAKGEQITLMPSPKYGYDFVGWRGACTGNISCTITIANHTSVQALYTTTSKTVNNSMVITEPHGKKHVSYPVQFGRPFIKGEITDFPQVLINDIEVESQADVKQRHDDGSVKHAIISFILPSLSANSQKTITFTNKVLSNNVPLTATEMLDTAFDFEAIMKFSFPEEKVVSARAMLKNGNFEYWQQGPIATTILLKDRTLNRRFDTGGDEYKSIHPSMYVTFWKDINRYSVRFIGEISNTEFLQDLNYDVELLTGMTEDSHYQHEKFFHHAKTRWTKKFWHKNKLEPLSINHNLAYLATTYFLPNFDTSINIPESRIEGYYNNWLNAAKGIADTGLWQKAMAVPGGRDDLGIYPTWVMLWLYSGDWRMEEISLTQSELAGSWPFFIREGRSEKFFDFAKTIPGIGKQISIAPMGRPTYWMEKPTWRQINQDDQIAGVIPLVKSKWTPDTAHHPDISTVQYLLSGDYFHLEQMYFSSAYITGNSAGYAVNSLFGRGNPGSVGALYKGEVREQGWALKIRAHTISITPDNHPEKRYYTRLLNNSLKSWEGIYQLNQLKHGDNPIWLHGKNIIGPAKFKNFTSIIDIWAHPTTDGRRVNSDFYIPNKVSMAFGPWMQYIVTVSLGRAEELGFCTTELKSFSGQLLIDILTKPNINPAIFATWSFPTTDTQNNPLINFQAINDTFSPSYIKTLEKELFSSYIETNMSPQLIAAGAVSYLTNLKNHAKAWDYVSRYVLSKPNITLNPKWAILPRPYFPECNKPK